MATEGERRVSNCSSAHACRGGGGIDEVIDIDEVVEEGGPVGGAGRAGTDGGGDKSGAGGGL